MICPTCNPKKVPRRGILKEMSRDGNSVYYRCPSCSRQFREPDALAHPGLLEPHPPETPVADLPSPAGEIHTPPSPHDPNE